VSRAPDDRLEARPPRTEPVAVRGRVSIWLTVLLILGALAALLGAAEGRLGAERGVSPRLALSGTPDADHALTIHSSGAGRAVVSARDMAPGDRAKGRVTVRVSGGRAHVSLRAGRVEREPGPLGGTLSKVLHIRVLALHGDGARTLYSGHPRGLRANLGGWRPGTKRAYRIVAHLPRRVGNQMQGAATSFRLVWRAFPIPGARQSGAEAQLELFG
jgi:hypothetical protein